MITGIKAYSIDRYCEKLLINPTDLHPAFKPLYNQRLYKPKPEINTGGSKEEFKQRLLNESSIKIGNFTLFQDVKFRSKQYRSSYKLLYQLNGKLINFGHLSWNHKIQEQDINLLCLDISNEDELKKLYDLKLSGMDEKIRDVFLIGCFTLQRFSDYCRISPNMIQSKSKNAKVIELIQTKTNQRVVIPIRPTLNTLLTKYGYEVPKVYPQKLNDRIKELARDVGITDPIQIEKYKGGKRIIETISKCDLIMSHTARRSGCTNMFKDGYQPITIMKISGHKTEREFLKYILISSEETADGLINDPNFNKPSW